MRALIESFAARTAQPDLFATWQEELNLRRRLREADQWQQVSIGTRAEYDFLHRALFHGKQRNIFFAIIYGNMSDQNVLTLLRESPPEVVTGFLDYVSALLSEQHPPGASLVFLVHIFQDDYRPQYARLIEALRADQCAHLLARTGNRNLRRMLKEHLERIKHDESEGTAGRPGIERISHPWATFHGDKIELLAAAAAVLKTNRPLGRLQDSNDYCLDNLLEGAELLFRAGLLADCIGLLSRVILDADLEKNQGHLAGDHPLHRQVFRLLDRVVPLYGLLLDPLHPHGWVLDNYRRLAPGFSPEPGSLLYLDLYAIVLAALQGRSQYAKYEIIQKSAQLQVLRDDDLLAAALVEWGKTGLFENVPTVVEALNAKMRLKPHETFAGLELLRYLHQEGGLVLGRPDVTSMLDMYLRFFYWLPAAVFLNEKLVAQMGPQADEAMRAEAEKILTCQQKRRNDTLATAQPSDIASRDEWQLKNMLQLSRSMGVL